MTADYSAGVAVQAPLSRLCVTSEATLRQALEAIDAGGAAIALVLDATDHLIGTLTDGDVRRALLAGAGLQAPITKYITDDFTAVRSDVDRAAVLDLMQARSINQVPIVDADRHLIGLHLLRDVLGASERPNATVIMAGGRGTRLHPYTATVPKPMVEVAHRPILERIVLHLVGGGIRTIFLAVNHMAQVIENHFGDGADFGCSIEYLRESPDTPLGTAGALTLLPADGAWRAHPLIVMNGDLLTDFNVEALLGAHRAAHAALTVGITDYTHQVPFGVVAVADGRLRSLTEKPTVTWAVNSGIYVIDPMLVRRIAPRCEYLMTQLVDTCLERDEVVHAHPIGPRWSDVGRPIDLSRVRGEEGPVT
ncbi:MAG TPA: sugar phosphate nucleotidyltransferase [Candidatus Binatia bacterium]|nr:sugar phosphate nucleotidyltransferase [Candidatus Binatia bacterium]